ncbi:MULTISPECIES: hypothetical protein [Clostridium]|nr:hypothetical protein [[Clostridium] innocuum]MCQ5279347.1 hypothetical protein [Clostridium sp. DFI.1.208]
MLSGIEKQPVIIKQRKAAMDQFAKWIRLSHKTITAYGVFDS